mgnify:FL=1|tara:strand:+ start:3426 stop:4154 length:729 start_codon:yes stop_codon:yes gene_type:complete
MSSEEETKSTEEAAEETEAEAQEPVGQEEEPERQAISMEELAEMLMSAAKEEESDEPSLESMRSLGLYGDVEEERVSEVIAGLLTLHHMGKPKISEDGEIKEEGKPIDMYISTYGGSADDMAALVDVMNMVKKDCDIKTIGLGKVMSAGVLILASGTKGQRTIGRNCRVMIHSVIAGNAGALHNLENELAEVKKMQEVYLDSLVEVTNLTKKQLKSFMRRKTNVYLTAEEAIKYGIADKILE